MRPLTLIWILSAFACGPSATAVTDGNRPPNDAGDGGGSVGADGSEAGASGSGGAASSCTEVIVTTSLTDRPTWGFYPVRGGVWRSDSELQIGWKAEVTDGASNKLWLYVGSYDPATGVRLTLRRYDVFPPGVTFDLGDIQAIGGSPSDRFAAALRSWDPGGQPRGATLFIGSLADDTEHTQVDLGWNSGTYDVTDIGWDGEAFAVHMKYSGVGTVLVTRVGADGTILLNTARYGTTPSPGVAYRMATSPVSGMSYLFDAPLSNRFLSGHDRTGSAVPWAHDTPWDVTAPGLAVFGDPATNPGVDADDAGGAWISWMRYDEHNDYRRVSAHVLSSGSIDTSFSLSKTTGLVPPAVGALSPSHVWLADTDNRTIMLAEFENGVAYPIRDILNAPPAPSTGPLWTPQDFAAVNWHAERWLAFTESSDLLHVVRVDGDCTYLSAFASPSH